MQIASIYPSHEMQLKAAQSSVEDQVQCMMLLSGIMCFNYELAH